MIMRKFLVLAMVGAFTACGSKSDDNNKGQEEKKVEAPKQTDDSKKDEAKKDNSATAQPQVVNGNGSKNAPNGNTNAPTGNSNAGGGTNSAPQPINGTDNQAAPTGTPQPQQPQPEAPQQPRPQPTAMPAPDLSTTKIRSLVEFQNYDYSVSNGHVTHSAFILVLEADSADARIKDVMITPSFLDGENKLQELPRVALRDAVGFENAAIASGVIAPDNAAAIAKLIVDPNLPAEKLQEERVAYENYFRDRIGGLYFAVVGFTADLMAEKTKHVFELPLVDGKRPDGLQKFTFNYIPQ